MNILIAPLNWGLGHATRCVPIIRHFIEEKHNVVLASNGAALSYLTTQFPSLTTIEIPGIDIKYSDSDSQIWAMARQLPHILAKSAAEHSAVKRYAKEHHIDMVISDNRFGLFGTAPHTTYITHQLTIMLPPTMKWAKIIGRRLHRLIINRYNECWIPDDPELKLSGDMANNQPLPRNAKTIGILSRFGSFEPNPEQKKRHFTNNTATTADIKQSGLPTHVDVFIPLSGPEPHKSILYTKLFDKYKGSTSIVLFLQGRPSTSIDVSQEQNIFTASHLPDHIFAYYLHADHTDHIICRSGYSTIMDLAATHYHLSAVTLIPTPGQPEQEYLAKTIKNQKSP